MRRHLLWLAMAAALFAASCAAVDKKTPSAPAAAKPAERLSVEEQEKLAFQAFEGILELTMQRSKHEILDELEARYREIMEKYPDSFLAQESHIHLVNQKIEYYYPPNTDEVEALYRQFTERYPGSRMKPMLDFAVARVFYSEKLWDKLIRFTRPVIARYVKTGELDGPYMLFLYSEAKFHTGEPKEAEKGYRTIMARFPGTTEAKVAGTRLEEMNKAGEKS